MNERLWQRNRDHFSQAEGTSCTMQPLLEMIGFGVNTKWADKVLKGEAEYPEVRDKSIIEILKECKQIGSPLRNKVPIDKMIEGFKKWKPDTSTSPSGKYLHIYHTIIKTAEDEENDFKEVARDATIIQHKLINLAIRECHTYK